MHEVTVTGVVPAPPDVVFDLLLDSRNDERWCPMASGYELVEGDEPGVGTVYRYTQQAGPGRRVTMHLRTTVADRPHALAWDDGGDSGELGYEGRMTLSPHPDGTHLRQTNRVRAGSRAEQLVWFTTAQVVLRVQLRRLARVLATA